MEAFRAMPPDWRLILVGSSGYGASSLISNHQDNRISFTGYIDDRELVKLYAMASIFAFPSLDEGFGMPVLEAMAAGIPVITSNRSAMPEIAGDAAILIDPEEVSQLAEALNNLAANTKFCSELAARGQIRAHQFTWERAARETWAVYQELL